MEDRPIALPAARTPLYCHHLEVAWHALAPVRSVPMDEKSREVLEAALSLSENQRASLVGALLETLPSETDEWDDDDLASELDRRLDEALRDPSSTVSWADLKSRR
jgi:putative addiction module component (TIGR02574 family)